MAVEPEKSGRMQKGPALGTLGTPERERLSEAQLTSAAAFVEGGVQDACDDACSICLENFSESNPATVTVCKHEYHLQCILEWAQRSKECPMCWQALCLKDQDGQSLLAAAEEEKALRQQGSPFFHYSTFDSEFHRFGLAFAEDSDLEDRILHRLAAATMARAQQVTGRGDSLRFRPSPGQGHSHRRVVPVHFSAPAPQLSTPPSSTSSGTLLMQPAPSSGDVGSSGGGGVSSSQVAPLESSSAGSSTSDTSEEGSSSMEACSSGRQQVLGEHVESPQGTSSSPELTNSESFKNRFVAASSKYRETLKRTTKSFRERLRGRNGTPEEMGTPSP